MADDEIDKPIDSEIGDEVLKRMLKTPPKTKTPESSEKPPTPAKKSDEGQVILLEVSRLRSDVAFLSRVTRQLRNEAIDAQIAYSRR